MLSGMSSSALLMLPNFGEIGFIDAQCNNLFLLKHNYISVSCRERSNCTIEQCKSRKKLSAFSACVFLMLPFGDVRRTVALKAFSEKYKLEHPSLGENGIVGEGLIMHLAIE